MPGLPCPLPLDLANKQKTKHILTHRTSKIDVFHNSQDGWVERTNAFIEIFFNLIQYNFFDHFFSCIRSITVPTKDHIDINNSSNSEFSPAYSVKLSSNPTQCEVDTFEHILQVTSHHEAVYAYYYKDEDNKVRYLHHSFFFLPSIN